MSYLRLLSALLAINIALALAVIGLETGVLSGEVGFVLSVIVASTLGALIPDIERTFEGKSL